MKVGNGLDIDGLPDNTTSATAITTTKKLVTNGSDIDGLTDIGIDNTTSATAITTAEKWIINGTKKIPGRLGKTLLRDLKSVWDWVT